MVALPRRRRLSILISTSLVSASLACAPAGAGRGPSEARPAEPDSESDAIAAAAAAFQRDYEDELRADPHSFLTVVAAHYLPPGQLVGFVAGPSGWEPRTPEPEPGPGVVRFEHRIDFMLVRLPESEVRVETRAEVPGDGRFEFTVSRQEQDWRVLVHDLEAPRRLGFTGLEWFEVDPSRAVEASFTPSSPRTPTVLQTSRGVTKTLYAAGEVRFEIDGQAQALTVFAYAPEPTPDEPGLIPFTDETTGRDSYAAGRYLEPTLPTDGRLGLDFNRATNPLCAYSEHYNCPRPPKFNHLSVEIRAGARSPR